MFVAATTQCYPDRPLDQAIEKLADLEFSHIEIGVSENNQHISPSDIVNNGAKCYEVINSTRRLTVIGLNLDIPGEGDEYFNTFTKCCELAKLSKIVTLTVGSGEQGTPFNEEVERYKSLVKIAEAHGVRVAMRSQVGKISADPDTVSVICGHVKGLGLSLDPFGPWACFVITTENQSAKFSTVRFPKSNPVAMHATSMPTGINWTATAGAEGECPLSFAA